MGKRIMSEATARAAIYVFFTLSLFAFLFLLRDARSYSAATMPPEESASQAEPEAEALPVLPTALSGGVARAAGSAAITTQSVSLPAITATAPLAPTPDEAKDPFGLGPDIGSATAKLDWDFLQTEIARINAMGFSLDASVSAEFMGEFHTTSYCCEAYPHICGGNGVTASGTVPTPGLTVAADWSLLPKNTWIFISGVGIRRVEDTGSAIKQARLDVAIDTHENALRWSGFGRHNVWVVAWPS